MGSASEITGEADFGKVIFADAEASALLSGHLWDLCNPEPPGWELVKRNSSRSVWRVEIEGRGLYLKQFHSRSFWHRLAGLVGVSDAKTEFKFMKYLSGEGIATARALAVGSGNGMYWLVSGAVAPATQLDHWHKREIQKGFAGLKRIRDGAVVLGEMIGKMHASGVVHCDLHCGNVMVKEVSGKLELVLMDLHRAKRSRRLSRRVCAKNLSHLLHDRFFMTTRTDRLRFLQAYLRNANIGGSLRGWVVLIEHFGKGHTARQNAQRDRRMCRNNKYFQSVSVGGSWQGHVVQASKRKLAGSRAAGVELKKTDWEQVLSDPDKLFIGDDVEVIKESRSGIVVQRKLQVGPHELDVFIKRPRRKQLWKIIPDMFRASRPIKAFRLGHALLARRIATALPIAAIERRVCGVLLDSILITEAVDAPVLKDFLVTWLGDSPMSGGALSPSQQRQLAQQVLCQLGVMLQRLHDNNFAHRDLKATNILVSWLPGAIEPELVLIDLDGLKRAMVVTKRKQYQGLMRLNVSLLQCPNVNHAGRLRMLLGYLCRPGCGRIKFKHYWRVLEKWSARKLRQQIRSRRKKQRAQRRPS